MQRTFGLETKEERAGETQVSLVTVHGYLDAHTVPQLEKELHARAQSGDINILLDFADLTYISSAGLGLLLEVQRSVQKSDGDLKIVHMPETIHNIFSILGFSKLIQVFGSNEDALAAFN